MLSKFCAWLLYKKMGWTKNVTIAHPDKYIICLAPHTSNIDFFIGQLYMRAEGMHINVMMKKEWFFWPLGPIFKRMGGIPVYRSKTMRMTDVLAQTAIESKQFGLCITPEGTRSLNAEWKRGFYHIAHKAHIPILLYGVDYKRRLIQCTCKLVPTGDVEREMKDIKQYYTSYVARHPERFTTGL